MTSERRAADEALKAHYRLAKLEYERRGAQERILGLLDELGVVEILRTHMPMGQHWQLDRLESVLRRIDSLDEAIADAQADRERADAEADYELEEAASLCNVKERAS